jgi:F0F1-type ATP synthase membrane subunit c/vacuolar-type H+-ATPase subunit K
MAEFHDLAVYRKLESMEKRIESKGGPPHNDDMEARVLKLEDFALDARDRLVRVETKLDHIDKEVTNLKWWMVGAALTIILTVIGTVVGTGIGIQQMTVATFQAAAAQPQQAAALPPIIINVPGGAPAAASTAPK